MKISNPTINGQEFYLELSQPLAALSEFYKAFNNKDFNLMKQNWLQTQEASMSNPLGGIKRGWQEIATVYETIFNGPSNVYVEYFDYLIYVGTDFFQAVGRERGHVDIKRQRIDLAIRTSRIFVLEGCRYKQLHHHGSIESPTLLKTYQAAVLKRSSD